MPNTCPNTPYSKDSNPYENKGKNTNPIQSPFSDKQTPYSSILPQIQPKYFCPLPKLLQENGGYLLLESGGQIIL